MRRHLAHGVVSTLLLAFLTVRTAVPAVGQGSLILQGLKLFGIVSGNPGSYIGAAQVQGPQAALDRVQAVAQIGGDLFSALRVKGLVPVDGLNPIPGHLHRVYGVGVTAIIDFRL
jgi:hypothetical protein